MKGTIEWLITVEQAAGELYRNAAMLFKKDKGLFSKKEKVVLICRAAASAMNFLEGFGIRQHKRIIIEIVDHQVHAGETDVYGSYNRIDNRLEVMSLRSIQSKGASSRINPTCI